MTESENFSTLLSYLASDFRSEIADPMVQRFLMEQNIPVIDQIEREKAISHFNLTKDLRESIRCMQVPLVATKESISTLLSFEKTNKIPGKSILPFVAFYSIGLLSNTISDENDIIQLLILLLSYYNSVIGDKLSLFIYDNILSQFLTKNFSSFNEEFILQFAQYCNISLRGNETAFFQLAAFSKNFQSREDTYTITNLANTLMELIDYLPDTCNRLKPTEILDVLSTDISNYDEKLILLLFKYGSHFICDEIELLLNKFAKLAFNLTKNQFTFLKSTDFPYININRPKSLVIEQETEDVINADISTIKNISTLSYNSLLFYKKSVMISEFMNFGSKIQECYKDSITSSIISCFFYCSHDERYIPFLFLIELFNITLTDDIFDIMTDTLVFNPSATIYNCDFDDFTIFVRSKIVNIIAQSDNKYFARFIDKFQNSPLLFAEIVSYLTNSIRNLDQNLLISKNILKAIYYSCSDCDSLISKSKDNENYQKSLFLARMSLFIYNSRLLEVSQSCMKMNYFVDVFMKAINFEIFRNLITKKIESILREKEDVKSAVTFVNNSLNILMSKNKYFDIGFQLIEVVSSVVSVNSELVYKIKILPNTVVQFLEKIPTLKNLTTTLNLLISVFMFSNVNLDDLRLIKLANTIIQINEQEKCENLTTKLLSLFSGCTTSSSNPSFLIKRKNLIAFFASIFSSMSKFPEFLVYMSKVMEFSYFNRIETEESGLDSMLLDLIINFPNDFIFRGFKIKNFTSKSDLLSIIPDLGTILSYKSNLSCAEKIMEIILHKSDIAQEFISMLIPKLTNINNMLPISNPMIYFTIDNILTTDFLKNSSLCFWIYIDDELQLKNHFELNILSSVLEDNTPFFNIWFKNNTITCKLQQETKTSEFSMLQSIKFSCWHLISISLSLDEANSSLTITVLIDSSNYFQNTISYMDELNTKMNLTVGNNIKQKSDKNELLTSVIIKNLVLFGRGITRKEHLNIYENKNLNVNIPILFSYPIQNESKYEVVLQKPFKGFIPELSNIFDVFRLYYPIENITSVFLLFDKLDFVKQVLIIDFLKHIYGEIFYNFFPLIPSLLLKQNPSILTFNLYNKFYLLLDVCKTEESLYSLYSNILMNFELWMRSAELQKIVQHWYSFLLKGYEYQKTENFVKKIIVNLRKYFYYENIEINFVSNLEKDKNVDIEKCNRLVQKMLIENCLSIITKEDIDFIFVNAKLSLDRKMKLILLEIGQKFSKSVKGSQKSIDALLSIDTYLNFELTETIVKSLYYLSEENLFNVNLINLIHLFNTSMKSNISHLQHRLKTINSSVSDLLNSNKTKLPDEENSEFLLSFNLLELVPLSYPIFLHVAFLNKENKEFKKTLYRYLMAWIEDEKFVEAVRSQKCWYLVPVFFYSQVNYDQEPELMKFICQISTRKPFSYENLTGVLNCFDVIQAISYSEMKNHKASILVSLICLDFDSNLFKESFEILFIETRQHINLCDLQKSSMSPELSYEDDTEEFDFDDYVEKNKIDQKVTDNLTLNDVFRIEEIRTNLSLIKSLEMINILSSLLSFCKICQILKTEVVYQILDYANSSKENQIELSRSILENYEEVNKMLDDRKSDILKTLFEIKSILHKINYNEMIEQTMSILSEFQENKEKSDFLSNKSREFTMKRFINKRSIWRESFDTKFRIYDRTTSFFFKTRLKTVLKTPKISQNYVLENTEFLNCSIPFKAQRISKKSTENCFFYLQKKSFTLLKENKNKLDVDFSDIQHILIRDVSKIEFFLLNGKSIYLDFYPRKNAYIMNKLASCNMPNLIFFQDVPADVYIGKIGLFKKWKENEISNLTFLILINFFCGKSYKENDKILLPFKMDTNDLFIPEFHTQIILNSMKTKSDKNTRFSDIDLELIDNGNIDIDVDQSEINNRDVVHSSFNQKSKINQRKVEDVEKFVKDTFGIEDNRNNEDSELQEIIWEKLLHVKQNSIPFITEMSKENTEQKFIHDAKFVPYSKLFLIGEKTICVSNDNFSIEQKGTEKKIIKIQGHIKDALKINDNLILFNKSDNEVSIFKDDEIRTDIICSTDFSLSASFGIFFALCSKVGNIQIFKFPDFTSPFYEVKVYFDSISCFDFNSDHRIVAVGTYDGYINVYDMNSSVLLNAVKVTNKTITKVSITKDYGFVVVFCLDGIVVLTCNGTVISRIEDEFDVRFACTYSFKGNDVVVFGSVRDQILCFNVGDSTIDIKHFSTLNENIIDIKYVEEKKCVIWATADCVIYMQPIMYVL